MKTAKRALALLLSLVFVLGTVAVGGVSVSAQEDYLTVDGFANQWARSDLRAWLNGLTKVNGNLPADGSNGAKGSESSKNFLNSFTNAELALFRPKTVITNVFNDSAVLDSSDDDKALTRTTSVVKTKDRFWAASGLLMRNHPNAYEDQLISADPGYDLADFYTYRQKVTNGKVNKWANIIPIPFWSGNSAYYDSMYLRSASYENTEEVLGSDSGYNVESYPLDDAWESACACGSIALPSDTFAAMAVPGETANGIFIKNEIDSYENLGKKNRSGSVPSWGMYLKAISLNELNGTLTYNSGEHTLTFATEQALPLNKYLMVQVYKNWDWNIGTETQNASAGDTVFTAGKEILSSDVTSVTFSFTGNDIPDLSEYTVKVWLEDKATNNSLAQVSKPLTFSIDENEAVTPAVETKSHNPRVFAYKSDLACSWGVYNDEDECTFIIHDEEEFSDNIHYEGTGATYQKLYIGTDSSGNPIEWWIAGRDGDTLTLYQSSGTENCMFNADASVYEGTVRNPSLYLRSDFTSDDIEDFITKVILSEVAVEQDDPSDCDGEFSYTGGSSVSIDDDSNVLDVPAEKLSLQFCKTDGSEWSDSPDDDGTYYVRAAFAGGTIDGVEYAPCFSNVRKINYQLNPGITITFSPETPVYGRDVVIQVNVDHPDEDGVITVCVDGKEYTTSTADPTITIPTAVMPEEDYVHIDPDDPDSPKKPYFDDMPDSDYIHTDFVCNLGAGSYLVTAEYTSGDGAKTSQVAEMLTVAKVKSEISTQVGDMSNGVVQMTNCSINSIAATGGVLFVIDGVEYPAQLHRGFTHFRMPGYLQPGTHTLTAIYPGDANHEFAACSSTFEINGGQTRITVTAPDTDVNEKPKVTVTVPEAQEGESFTLTVTDSAGETVSENTYTFTAPQTETVELDILPAGKYTVEVTYYMAQFYNGGVPCGYKAETTLRVLNKTALTINTPDSITFGDDAELTFALTPAGAPGTIKVFVDGAEYSLDAQNASLSISDLNAGNHLVCAVYEGAEGYSSSFAETIFTVSKLKPEIIVTRIADSIPAGRTQVIKARISSDKVTGNYMYVFLAGAVSHRPFESIEGEAGMEVEYTSPLLESGPYSVILYYPGDENHEFAVTAAQFTVGKEGRTAAATAGSSSSSGRRVPAAKNSAGETVLSVKPIAPVTYGEEAVVELEIAPATATGEISVFINNTEYTTDTEHLTLRIPTVVNPDAEDKLKSDLPVKPEPYGIVIPQYYDIPGDEYEPNENLNAGGYLVHAEYKGDENNAPASAAEVLTVNKIQPELTVNMNNSLPLGEALNMEVSLSSEDATGDCYIILDGILYTRNIEENATGNIKLDTLSAGTHSVTVIYAGNRNCACAYYNTVIEVTDSGTMTVDAPDSRLGETAAVTVSIPGEYVTDSYKSVTVNVYDKITGDLKNEATAVFTGIDDETGLMTATAEFDSLEAGEYYIRAVHTFKPGEIDGAYKYDIEATATLRVAGMDSGLSIEEPDECCVGDDVNLQFNIDPDATGEITVYVDCVKYAVTTAENPAVTVSGLTAGRHFVSAEYEGDEAFEPCKAQPVTVTVGKNEPLFTIECEPYIGFGEEPEFIIHIEKPDMTDDFTVYIDGVEYHPDFEDGEAAISTGPIYIAHKASYFVLYNGDDKYEHCYKKGTFEIGEPTKCIVIFAHDDGSELQNSEFAFDETPVYEGETPVKTDTTGQYTYTFAGWTDGSGKFYTPDEELPLSDEGRVIYTATYSKKENTYTVNVSANGDGEVEINGVTARSALWNCEAAAPDTMEYDSPDKTEYFSDEINATIGDTVELTITGEISNSPFMAILCKCSESWGTEEQLQSCSGMFTPYNVSFDYEGNPVSVYYYEISSAKGAGYTLYQGRYTLTINWLQPGTYAYGTEVTVKAAPNEGSNFVNWTENGDEVSADAEYSFTVTGNRELLANFEKQKFTVQFVNEDGTELQTSQVPYGETPAYTGETPTKEATAEYTYTFAGWSPEITSVTGEATYTATFTETPVDYKLTWKVDGESYRNETVPFGNTITKPDDPVKEGYTFEWVDQIPETMPAQDVTINGEFTVIEYTATFVDENGETVEKVTFTVETESITEPAVPEKAGYTGEWEEYTLAAGDITIRPVYKGIASVEIENFEEQSEIGYKEDKTFTAKADDLPEGAEIHWFVNGEDVGTGESCTVEDPTDDYTVQAKVIDKNGNVLDESSTAKVKVRNGFFDRLKAFFAELIEKILGKAIADLLSSIC